MHLIGLIGQIAPNRVISRLGILQAPDPNSCIIITNPPGYIPLQHLLWAHTFSSDHRRDLATKPIWHPTNESVRLTLFPRSDESGPTYLPFDMVPHTIFLCASTPRSYQYLTAIDMFEVSRGSVMTRRGGETWYSREILGMRLVDSHKHGNPGYVGSAGPVPAMVAEWRDPDEPEMPRLQPSSLNMQKTFGPFCSSHTTSFEIDGFGGEIITEVHVSYDCRAIMLVTNFEQECSWGEEGKEDWHVETAQEGEVICGLVLGFGALGGWSRRAMMWSHWRVSTFGVVYMKDDREPVEEYEDEEMGEETITDYEY